MALTSMQSAEADWSHAKRELLLKEVVCFFKGCSVDLLSFEEVRRNQHLDQHIDRGLQVIPLDQIRGSVGRYNDFASSFLPRNNHMLERWRNVAVAMQQGKTPPIEVYQVGDTYFVLDGNHRVSVAHQRGLDKIEAYVMEFITPVEVGDESNIDEALLNAESAAFVANAGPANQETAQEVILTCAGCYRDITDQIETYRQGYEKVWNEPMTYEQAFSAWHGEVYAPAVEAIRENDMLSEFPDRTEADLFIWSWQNNQSLEELSGNRSAAPADE